MDSGNSSSMQSSSGGADDHEYDSRSFFQHTTTTTNPFLFSPDPNFMQPPFSFPDLLSSGPIIRPDQPLPFPGSSSSSASIPQPTTAPHPLPPKKTSKKRSRASRKAPTTVLTTDTSNFRAMVQEFTGIPAHPFSASSTSTYSRLLAGSSFRSAAAQRFTPHSSPMTSSSSLFNIQQHSNYIQNQLPASGHQMGITTVSGQPDYPILTLQSLLQQPNSTSSSLLPPHQQQLGFRYQQDAQTTNDLSANADFGLLQSHHTRIGSSSDEPQSTTFMGIQHQGGSLGNDRTN